MYLFLDPGETTGIARFDDKGTPTKVFQIYGVVELGMVLDKALSTGLFKKVLYESFRVFGHANLTGSDVPAAKVIGIIEFLCEKYNVPCEGIQPKYKKIGYAWSGKRAPSDHSKSHGPDAEALGEYWLRTHGVKDINA